MNNALVWFRQDLRIRDNRALAEACAYARERGGRVSALYIATPGQWRQHDVAPMQLDFIERHLQLLSVSLGALGIELQVVHLDNFSLCAGFISQLCRDKAAGALFGHMEPEINECLRDRQVADALSRESIAVHLYPGHSLLPTGSVLNRSGKMFKVFTPFSRAWRTAASRSVIVPVKVPKSSGPAIVPSSTIALNCEKRDSQQWPAGEQVAAERLISFVNRQAGDYQKARDFPAMDGTSGLSPYLAIGVLSPRQCVAALLSRYPDALDDDTSKGFTWLNELCWRDFYRHLLVAFPQLSKGQNFKHKADQIVWRNNTEDFDRWCKGETGYPIVDAAMKQLQQRGWMHNRLRMIVASFLTKHLLIDWRWGEGYFRRQLIDGDLASNNGGWQWAAGTGCDAQPYFRIFNPMTQSARFDPHGDFIRKFLPQLAGCDTKSLHQADIKQQQNLFGAARQTASVAYPAPMVEHRFARQRALTTLSVMKRSDQAIQEGR